MNTLPTPPIDPTPPPPATEDVPANGNRTLGRWLLRRWLAPLIVAALITVGGIAAIMSTGPAPSTPAATYTPLEQAERDCGRSSGVQVADAGRTLIIDHKGEDDTTGASIEELACVLVELGAPSSVTARMDSTRALDGVQTGTWDEYLATWSYHPNSGINLIIEERK